MNNYTIMAMSDELQKIAGSISDYTSDHVKVGSGGMGGHAAEVIGLGTLAAPTIQKMRGKPMSEGGEHAAELGGLGILAVPSAFAIAKRLVKKGSATKISMPVGGLKAGLMNAAHAAKGVVSGGGESAQKIQNLARAAARNKSLAGAGTSQFASHSMPVVQGKLL